VNWIHGLTSICRYLSRGGGLADTDDAEKNEGSKKSGHFLNVYGFLFFSFSMLMAWASNR